MQNSLDDLYAKAYVDLNKFRHTIQLYEAGEQEKLPPAEFHKRWGKELLFGKESVAVEGFRECGKSSIIKAFLLHCLTFPVKERSYICVMRGNKTAASKIVKEIALEYKTNPLLYRASLKSIQEESAECFCIETHTGVVVRIEAYGKGSAIRGASFNNRRPDIIVLDDIQDKEDMRSESIPETDWDWFLSDIKFLGRDTRFFMIANNLGDKCIAERLLASADENGVGLFGFQCYRIPAIVDGKSSWESRFSVDYLLKEREQMASQGKLDIWLMERMCLSTSDETRVFKREDFRYYDANNNNRILETSNIICTLDPASSSNVESCYRALVVIAVNSENQWFILDVRYGRWDSVGMLDEIFATVRKWRLKHIGIEKGHYQQVIEPFLHKEMARRNVFFDVKPLEHGKRGSKLERIKMLAPRFAAHTVFMPQESDFKSELESELLGVTRTAIKSQYIDIVDAIAMAEQIAEIPLNEEFYGTMHDGLDETYDTNIKW